MAIPLKELLKVIKFGKKQRKFLFDLPSTHFFQGKMRVPDRLLPGLPPIIFLINDSFLDFESQTQYELKVISNKNPHQVLANVNVKVENVNDNLPQFNVSSTKILWKINPLGMRKYSILGKVAAFDPDGDQVVYGLDHPDPCCIVVPQTGEVMLVDPEAIPTQLAILAKEKTNPSRQSRLSTVIGKEWQFIFYTSTYLPTYSVHFCIVCVHSSGISFLNSIFFVKLLFKISLKRITMLKMSSLKNPLMKDISDKNVEQLVQSGEKFHEILIIT